MAGGDYVRKLLSFDITMTNTHRRAENRRARRKILGARLTTNNKLNPHMVSPSGFEPGPHWWEASALTNTSPLLPNEQWTNLGTVMLRWLASQITEVFLIGCPGEEKAYMKLQ